jgi:phenylacetate-CoA ligase
MAAARLSADYPVEWVTTDEALPLGVQQRAMRRVFGISSKRSYIDPHAVASITEHADGALVIDEDYAAVELIAGDEDGTYRVIGTNLSNAAAPLLRYDTGSVVRLAKAVPVAGAPRHVATWEGPLQNLITLPSGARIGRLERMFDDLPQVIAAQIFQHADLIIDVDVRMAPGSTKAEAGAVSDRVAARFGAATCRVNYTDRLAPVTGGKLRAVHSEAGGVNRTVVEPRARLVCIQ